MTPTAMSSTNGPISVIAFIGPSTETSQHAPGHTESALWSSSRTAQTVLTTLASNV